MPFNQVPDVSDFVDTVDDRPDLARYNTSGDQTNPNNPLDPHYKWAIISEDWMVNTDDSVSQAAANAGLISAGMQYPINSAYRNPVHYWRISSDPKGGSQHLWGAAIDFAVWDFNGNGTTSDDYWTLTPLCAPYGMIVWENRTDHVHIQQYATAKPNVSSLSFMMNTVTAGKDVSGTITLKNPVSLPATGPVSVTLSSSNPALANPTVSSVQINPGQLSASFTVHTNSGLITSPTPVTIYAKLNGTKKVILTVNP